MDASSSGVPSASAEDEKAAETTADTPMGDSAAPATSSETPTETTETTTDTTTTTTAMDTTTTATTAAVTTTDTATTTTATDIATTTTTDTATTTAITTTDTATTTTPGPRIISISPPLLQLQSPINPIAPACGPTQAADALDLLHFKPGHPGGFRGVRAKLTAPPITSPLYHLLSLLPFALPILPEDEKFAQPCSPPTAEELLEAAERLKAQESALTPKERCVAYDRERDEYEEDEDSLRAKVKEAARLIKEAQHAVVFTGAGVSTSADIADFRGPRGVWTMRDQGRSATSKEVHEVRPTLAHYGITELVRKGLLRYVISTNMDGLHLRSGLPAHLLTELHGNSYKEICSLCKQTYLRQFQVGRSVTKQRLHFTGRRCTFCGSELQDTIVHFTEQYRTLFTEEHVMAQSQKADVMLILGTSMNVQPSACYPEQVLKNNPGSLILVNLQRTPYDHLCALRVFARTDRFMELLLDELNLLQQLDTSFDALPTWLPDLEAKSSKKFFASWRR